MARQWGRIRSWHIVKAVNVLSGLHVTWCGRVIEGHLVTVPDPGDPTCESCYRNEQKAAR